MLRLDYISVHIHRINDFELVFDTEISKLPSEWDFIVSQSTVFALEWRHDDLLEERNFGEEESSSSIFLTVHAQGGDLLSYKES